MSRYSCAGCRSSSERRRWSSTPIYKLKGNASDEVSSPCVDAQMRREKLRRTEATPDAIAGLIHAGAAKAFVMSYVSQLVADGYAEWGMFENGDVQLRCHTGEIFLLAKATITRIA
jgi:hypothetical protein